MNLTFLFWFFLAGIIIATVQDLKRKEIDHWLNQTLLMGGIVFILLFSILNKTFNPSIQLIISLAILFGLSNIFYYGRVFAGGDSSLLFALSALFVGTTIFGTLMNIATYTLTLLISAAIYGSIALTIIYIKNFKETNKAIKPKLKKIKYPYILLTSLILILLANLSSILPAIGVILAFYPLLYYFSKTLEETAMIKLKNPKQLQEGDWLAQDIKLKNKTLEYNWDGLSREDIKLIQKNTRKKIKLKDGLAFAPAFLLAHILYWLLKDNILSFLGF